MGREMMSHNNKVVKMSHNNNLRNSYLDQILEELESNSQFTKIFLLNVKILFFSQPNSPQNYITGRLNKSYEK